MSTIATTRMSSKGQVVIPEEIRKRLGLVEGAQFIVLGQGDAVILKSIATPSIAEFDELLGSARKEAKRIKLKRTDVVKAVAKSRKRSRQ